MEEKSLNDLSQQHKETLFKIVKMQADNGDERAYPMLAEYYSTGFGTEKDMTRAVQYWQLSADGGNMMSQYNLAIAYLNGSGVDLNADKGIELMFKSAEQGYAPAIYSVGALYETGAYCEPDLKKAFKYYQKAAQAGYVEAQFSVGIMYAKGKIVDKDVDKAIAWWEKAAEQGHEKAKHNIEVLSKNPNALDDQQNAENEKHAKEVLALAEQGDVKMQYYLGVIYETGNGLEQDFQKAKQWYELASQNGNSGADFRLGNLYATGKLNLTEDIENAVVYWQKSANNGNAGALLFLALVYFTGFKVEQNDSLAQEYLQKSVELGSAIAKELMDVYKNNGQNVDLMQETYNKYLDMYVRDTKLKINQPTGEQSNPEKPKTTGKKAKASKPEEDATFVEKDKYWYEQNFHTNLKKADNGDVDAMVDIAYVYSDKNNVNFYNPTSAEKWLKQAIEKENDRAMLLMAKLCFSEILKTLTPKQTIDYFKRLSAKGYAEAMYYLAFYYEDNLHLKQDRKIAYDLYYQAALRNDNASQYMLYTYFANGYLKDLDKEESIKWLKTSAMNGNYSAMLSLGEEYLFGTHIEKDYDKAMYWLLKCQRDSYAFIYIGDMYAKGLGVEKDLFIAIIFYYIALFAKGNYEAYARRRIADAYIEMGKPEHIKSGLKVLEDGYMYGYISCGSALACYLEEGKIVERDAERAVEIFERCAKNGDSVSLYKMASFYLYGINVKTDYQKAFEYFSELENKHIERLSQAYKSNVYFAIGYMYINGFYVDKDESKYKNYMLLADKFGNEQAKYFIALDYLSGKNGFAKDAKKGYAYALESAQLGHKRAMELVADLLEKGYGTAKNESMAKSWRKKAGK